MSLWHFWEPRRNFAWEPCGNLRHGNLGSLGNLGNLHLGTGNLYSGTLWEPLLGKLGNLYFGHFGALYLATWEPLLGNLLGPSGICTWEPWGPSLGSLYSELLWEPAQCNFGNRGSPVEPLLGNLAGTATMGTLDTLYEPVLGNPLIYLVGNLDLELLWEPV